VVSSLSSAPQVHNYQVCDTFVMNSRAHMDHPAQGTCTVVTPRVFVELEHPVESLPSWRHVPTQGPKLQQAVPAPPRETQLQVSSTARHTRLLMTAVSQLQLQFCSCEIRDLG